MPKYASAIAASLLSSVPIVWALYFVVVYRCDLNRYWNLWTSGTEPSWLTAWELSVTAAGLVVIFFLAPSIALLWKTGKRLSRSEWISMLVIVALVGVAIGIAPAAMMDLTAHFDALLGNKSGVCPH